MKSGLPNSWEQHQLDKLTEMPITYGVVQPGPTDTSLTGVRFVRSGDIACGRVLVDQLRTITPKISAQYGRTRLLGGEVVVSLVGNPGEAAVVPDHLADGNVARQVGLVRLSDETDAHFVSYCLQSPQGKQALLGVTIGSVQAVINLRDLKQVQVPWPRQAERRRITALLRTLDDKIDSNRRLASLLEDTVTAVFRARFVAFVGVEEFDESEIGPIPRGWTISPIGDNLIVVGGSTPSTKEPRYWEGGTYCWATPKDLSGASSSILLDTTRHITDAGVEQISSGVLPKRTVLLSSRAPIGYTALSMVEVAVNQGFIAIPPTEEIPSEYILLWLRANMDMIKGHAGGTTFAEISKRQFRPLSVLLPRQDALASFEDVARPMFDLITSLQRETETLTTIRDALLPKLISGEIRVPDTNDPNEVIGPAAEHLGRAAQ